MTNLDRTIAPDFRAIDHINLIKPEHKKLDNGCQVYCFNSGGQELVRIEWIFSNLRFNAAKPLLNMAVNAMLTEGTATLSAAQIADKVDYYGGFLQVDYGYENSQVTLYSLNKHLHHTLPVIVDMLTNSVFPEKELETFKRNQQQKLQVSLKKNDVVARRDFNKAIYGDTIYGLGASFDNYKNLQRNDLVNHYREMYQPANCTIVIAGKVDEQALSLITETFSNWTNIGSAADTTQPELQPAKELFYFSEKPDALQSAIRIGRPLINRNHPDFQPLQVLNTVLGGYFGSRLMANIREDKGYTYGIGSGVSSFRQGGSFFIATEVGADVCRSAITEIEKEVNLVKTEQVPDEELALVKNYMLGSFLGSLENVFSHADKFKSIHFAGLGYDYYDRYTATIKGIDPAKLIELANTYFQFDQFYKVVVGKY